MKKRATIRDIAQTAGVSTATVSRYINKSGLVDEKTASRIQEVITRLDYKPNLMAQSLKTRKTKNILLIIPDINNPFYADMAQAIQVGAKKQNHTIALYHTNGEYGEEIKAIHAAVQMNVSGIIMASVDMQERVIHELAKLDLPVIGVNAYEKCPFDTVHGVRMRGTYLATKHLIGIGHKRIAFAGGSKRTTIGRSRQDGYFRALAEAGLKTDESLVFEMGFSVNSGYKAGRYFSTVDPLPTAVCCANDLVALGVMNALRDMGIAVPDDISVTGMDDIPYAVLMTPRLTTVTNDSAEVAAAVLRMLFERIHGEYSGLPREVLIERKLIVRESTLRLD
jgi:LacI family transcriptional regulator